jgi:hypothetical protein
LKAAEALSIVGIHAAGNANNVNYRAAAIRSSLKRLDELRIGHTGAGVNLGEARKPVLVERDGVRFGFLQRTSLGMKRSRAPSTLSRRKLTGCFDYRRASPQRLKWRGMKWWYGKGYSVGLCDAAPFWRPAIIQQNYASFSRPTGIKG